MNWQLRQKRAQPASTNVDSRLLALNLEVVPVLALLVLLDDAVDVRAQVLGVLSLYKRHAEVREASVG